MSKILLEAKNISKIFKRDLKQELLVLENIDFNINYGEIVSLLGRSGCGKSTLLRIIAGLINPSSGIVKFKGKEVSEPARGIAMVFQNFALIPWLTVLQNVELGLEALGFSQKSRRNKSLKAIDMIGLDGFESAFPKELSGGMRQRVGIARALVVEPDILLMDEPFSSLDVLTADNLRNDLLDLWHEEKNKKRSIIFVTHNIEEAIFLSDRAIIFETNPGRVSETLNIEISHPREYQDKEFRTLVDTVYSIMTKPSSDLKKYEKTLDKVEKKIGLDYRFPDADVSELIGLIEKINELQEFNEKKFIDLPNIADELSIDIDSLLSLTEVLGILEFTEEANGDIKLTTFGNKLYNADIQNRKKIFADHLLRKIPFIKFINDELIRSQDNRISKKFFLAKLEENFTDDEADRLLKNMIQWGRYAELFAYDDANGELNLENPE